MKSIPKPVMFGQRCDEIEKDAEVKKRTAEENKKSEELMRKCPSCGKARDGTLFCAIDCISPCLQRGRKSTIINIPLLEDTNRFGFFFALEYLRIFLHGIYLT